MGALVAPSEVNENRPMLDLLWRTCFRWHLRSHHATADTMYGTRENVAVLERGEVRAYVGMPNREFSNKKRFPVGVFRYHSEKGAYTCSANEPLPFRTQDSARRGASTGPTPKPATPAHVKGTHRLGEGPHHLAPLRRGLLRQAARLSNPEGLPQGPAQKEGVGGAAVRGGQAVARAGPREAPTDFRPSSSEQSASPFLPRHSGMFFNRLERYWAVCLPEPCSCVRTLIKSLRTEDESKKAYKCRILKCSERITSTRLA